MTKDETRDAGRNGHNGTAPAGTLAFWGDAAPAPGPVREPAPEPAKATGADAADGADEDVLELSPDMMVAEPAEAGKRAPGGDEAPREPVPSIPDPPRKP